MTSLLQREEEAFKEGYQDALAGRECDSSDAIGLILNAMAYAVTLGLWHITQDSAEVEDALKAKYEEGYDVGRQERLLNEARS